MEKTPHILFAGDGAEQLAEKYGLELVDREYFITPERKERFEKQQQEDKGGTVGAVALDMEGNLAAATSTGGMSNKMPGRIGDSPIINAGTYADNETCAVSSTGWGEKYIINAAAFSVSAFMKWRGMDLQEAADELIWNILDEGDGGIIAVDRKGNYIMEFNTQSMLRGAVTSNGIEEVGILQQEYKQ
jgi:beta-aspartyl-peptidase (threonine type)